MTKETSKRRGLVVKLYRLVTLGHSRAYRREYGELLVETFVRQLDHTGALFGRVGFVVRELGGAVIAVIRERLGTKRPAPNTQRVSMMLSELRFASRRLARSPGFSFATVLTLALGIGVNTAIFSLVYGVLMKPLPYFEPQELVRLEHRMVRDDGVVTGGQSFGTYRIYRDAASTLTDIAFYQTRSVTVTGDVAPERIDLAVASHTLFSVLGSPPLIGRVLRAEDDIPTAPNLVVLAYDFWMRRFGGDQSVLGRSVELNATPFEVIGVMPPGFAIPSRSTGAWIARRVDFETAGFGGIYLSAIGRRRPDVTPTDVEVEIASLAPRVATAYPVVADLFNGPNISPVVTGLQDHIVGGVKPILLALLATVGLVLLIVLANVANLFLVRSESRSKELSVRAALGARKGDLLRYFLSESVLLTTLGGAFGVALAVTSIRLLSSFGASYIPRFEQVGLNIPVLLFTGILAFVAALSFGSMPLLRGMGRANSIVRDGNRGSTADGRRQRMRKALVVAQVALAFVLLVGAGLMTKSVWQLRRVDPGFVSSDVLTFELALPGQMYFSRADVAVFWDRLLEDLEAVPEVVAAGAVGCLPLSPCSWTNSNALAREDTPTPPGEMPPSVDVNSTAPGYFRSMGIPLMAGRTFERFDNIDLTGAAVISAGLARRFWPDEDPLGKRIYPNARPNPDAWYTVVGVVGDVRNHELTDPPAVMVYLPLVSNDPSQWWTTNTMSVIVRVDASPGDVVSVVERVVHDIDPNLVLARVATMDRVMSDAAARSAFAMLLLTVAAGLAVLLGSIGVYGVIAYVVAQRRSEFGLRIALGARPAEVVHMVLRQGGLLAVMGVAVGVPVAAMLGRPMQAVLYDVSAVDPVTYVLVIVVLLGVSLGAILMPALRAARVEPGIVLNAD